MKILYKIINSVAVLAIIPVLLFLPMFKFIMVVGVKSDNQLLSLFGNMLDVNEIIKNAAGIDLENLPESYTLKEAYNMFFGANAQIDTSQFDASILPENLVKFFTAAGVLFVISLICALVVLILGIVTNKKIVTGAVATGGLIFAVAANRCFTHIASQLVSGKISLVSVLANMESLQQYKTYLDYLNLDIRIFELSSAYTMLIVVFAAIIILNVGFRIVEETAS